MGHRVERRPGATRILFTRIPDEEKRRLDLLRRELGDAEPMTTRRNCQDAQRAGDDSERRESDQTHRSASRAMV